MAIAIHGAGIESEKSIVKKNGSMRERRKAIIV